MASSLPQSWRAHKVFSCLGNPRRHLSRYRDSPSRQRKASIHHISRCCSYQINRCYYPFAPRLKSQSFSGLLLSSHWGPIFLVTEIGPILLKISHFLFHLVFSWSGWREVEGFAVRPKITVLSFSKLGLRYPLMPCSSSHPRIVWTYQKNWNLPLRLQRQVLRSSSEDL